MGIKSNNPSESYFNFFGASGKGAMQPPSPFEATGGTKTTYNGKTIHEFASTGPWAVTAPSPGTVIEYVVIGGGASGGSCSGSYGNSGGGGAGAVIIGTETIGDGSPVFNSSQTVTIGDGGAAPSQGDFHGIAGEASSCGPITAPGGGYGSMGDASPKTGGGPGGSGGGGAGGGGVGNNDLPGPSSGDPWPGTPGATSPTNGFGYDGGTGVDNGQGYCGAGGGGAGGVGQDGTFGQGGYGGVGIQLPSTFSPPTNPFGFVGSPTPYGSNNWVAGGGGGGINASGPQSPGDRGHGGGSPDVATPWSGGGNAGKDGTPANSASANSGAGGGGTGGDDAGVDAGSGGSGLVLIAYPT